MEKWIFFAATLMMVFVCIEAIKWLGVVKKMSTKEIEKLVGYEASGLPSNLRDQMSGRHRSAGMPFTVVVMMCAMTMATAVVTFKRLSG